MAYDTFETFYRSSDIIIDYINESERFVQSNKAI